MLLERPSDDTLYAALLARDAAYDGYAYAAVRTTGIFCRLTCPARKPKRAHVIFFETAAECLEAGFRPCLRCRPLSTGREPEPAVSALIDFLEQEPDRRWGERDLIERGYDPSTVRRQFKRRFDTRLALHGTPFQRSVWERLRAMAPAPTARRCDSSESWPGQR